MIDISKIINKISLVFGKFISNDINKLNQIAHRLSTLSDEELQQKCYDKKNHIKRDKGLWNYIVEKIPFIQNIANDAIIENLALGVAAFNKCPADLSDTVLYPSQIKAALLLTQPCVLQMDTGEGKTYALLPAVFTLSRKYDKVYILCANEYLAQRDAVRTKNYWDFVGLDVQFCSKNDCYDDEKWEGDVIYTTLTTLMFKGLKDDLNKVPYKRKLSFDAIVIDEIDAVLFDSSSNYSIARNINSNIYDWASAIKYAQILEECVDITIDMDNLTASLTISGEEKIKKRLSECTISFSQYGQLRKAIEISFVALSLEEDKDYVFHNNKIYSVNRYTGEIEYDIAREWVIPLEVMKGLNPRPHKILLHTANHRVFIKQFNHISGMSGTALEDSAEYFYVYNLPTVVIEPRKKRQEKGRQEDEIYKNLKDGINAICQEAISAVKQRRPILIGTQNIKDATLIYNSLCDKMADIENINLITGKNNKKIAEIYQRGGEVGSIIIATQLAGRGVDIRLSNEAKNNGGLALLGFERGVDLRHDKQFLGRAGRQGDPYTAKFIITTEGHLMKTLGAIRIKSVMERLNTQDGEAISHKLVSASILGAQNKVRANEFYKRRAQDFKMSTDENIYHNIKNWFSILNTDDNNNKDMLSERFVLYVIDHFVKSNLYNVIRDNLNAEEARGVITNISCNLNIKESDLINSLHLEGKNKDIVKELIKNNILDCITNAFPNNEKNKNTYTCNYRTPYLIAYWTIVNAVIDYHNIEKKLVHSVWQDDLNLLQHHRLLSDGLVSEWDKIESRLSASILYNMLVSPESLDGLFFYNDNTVYNYKDTPEESELVKEWDSIKNNSVMPPSKSEETDFGQKLIYDFIAQSESQIGLGIDFSIESLNFLLTRFIAMNPINILQRPDKIIEALELWKREEVNTGVSEERKIKNHKWIKSFLNFLSKRNIIVMPSFKHKVNTTLQKMLKNVKDYKIIAPMVTLILWGFIFCLLSIFGNWFHPLSSHSFGIILIDNFLCAGWLQKGIVTAPIFLLYLSSNYPWKNNFVAKYACSLVGAISLVLLSIQLYDLNSILLAIIFCVFISILYINSINLISYTEKSLNLSLVSIWIIFCISSSFLPNLDIIPLSIFMGVLIYYCFLHRRINKEEIMLMSSQIAGSYTNLETYVHKKMVFVDGNVKSIPHIYALICSGIISSLITYIPKPYNVYNIYIIIFSYIVVLLLLTKEIVRKKTSIHSWKQTLNHKQQVIIDKDKIDDDIIELSADEVLISINNKLFKKEMLLQVTVFIFCVIILKDYQLYNFQYPLSLVILFSSFLFGEHIIKFAEQISHLLIFSGRITNETLDFQKVKEPEDDKTFMQKIRDFFRPFAKTRRFLNTILSAIAILYFFMKIYDLLLK